MLKKYYKHGLCVVLFLCGLFSIRPDAKKLNIIIPSQETPNYVMPNIYRETKDAINVLLNSNVCETQENIYVISHNLGMCNLSTETNEIPTFGDDITFSSELFIREGFPHYVLYTPSSSVPHQNIPLIFWMHGGGEFGGSDEYFMTTGLLKVLNEWDLEGFNAYVVCPQMKDEYCYNWCTDFAIDVVTRLIDDLVSNYNIDPNRIYLMGHSQGARGVMHMSYHIPEYFAASIAMSPFSPSVKVDKITIPIKAYTEYHSDFTNFLECKWGCENVTRMISGHGLVPKKSMYIDNDGNNRSDIIEWLFAQTKNPSA